MYKTIKVDIFPMKGMQTKRNGSDLQYYATVSDANQLSVIVWSEKTYKNVTKLFPEYIW